MDNTDIFLKIGGASSIQDPNPVSQSPPSDPWAKTPPAMRRNQREVDEHSSTSESEDDISPFSVDHPDIREPNNRLPNDRLSVSSNSPGDLPSRLTDTPESDRMDFDAITGPKRVTASPAYPDTPVSPDIMDYDEAMSPDNRDYLSPTTKDAIAEANKNQYKSKVGRSESSNSDSLPDSLSDTPLTSEGGFIEFSDDDLPGELSDTPSTSEAGFVEFSDDDLPGELSDTPATSVAPTGDSGFFDLLFGSDDDDQDLDLNESDQYYQQYQPAPQYYSRRSSRSNRSAQRTQAAQRTQRALYRSRRSLKEDARMQKSARRQQKREFRAERRALKSRHGANYRKNSDYQNYRKRKVSARRRRRSQKRRMRRMRGGYLENNVSMRGGGFANYMNF